MNEIYYTLAGAFVTGAIALFFKWVASLKDKKEAADEKTITQILTKLEEESRKEINFMEQWGALKNEVQSMSSSAMVIKEAARDILVMRRDLETCFKRVDELRNIFQENQLILKTANARLFLIRQALVKHDIEIDASGWLNPKNEV